MTECTICNAVIENDDSAAVLFIGHAGRAHTICPQCERLMDAVTSEDVTVAPPAKNELYTRLQSNERIQNNVELLDFFSQFFIEKDASDTEPESEIVNDILSNDENLPQEERPRLFEFKDGFSKKAINHIRKQQLLTLLPGGIVISLLFAIPITIWHFSLNLGAFQIPGLIILWLLFAFIPFMIASPPSAKQKDLFCPSLLFVEGEFVVAKSAKFYEERRLSDVKTVIDYGEYYRFVFHSRRRSAAFLCAKDGITLGSLEQFEKLFEGKIARKPTAE